MKIVAFGDIHTATSMPPPIKGLARADLIIVTGDLTCRGRIEGFRETLWRIPGFSRKLLCLAGGMDNGDVNDYFEESGLNNLHGRAYALGSRACVYGVGASSFTPCNTPWERSGQQLRRCAEKTGTTITLRDNDSTYSLQ